MFASSVGLSWFMFFFLCLNSFLFFFGRGLEEEESSEDEIGGWKQCLLFLDDR